MLPQLSGCGQDAGPGPGFRTQADLKHAEAGRRTKRRPEAKRSPGTLIFTASWTARLRTARISASASQGWNAARSAPATSPVLVRRCLSTAADRRQGVNRHGAPSARSVTIRPDTRRLLAPERTPSMTAEHHRKPVANNSRLRQLELVEPKLNDQTTFASSAGSVQRARAALCLPPCPADILPLVLVKRKRAGWWAGPFPLLGQGKLWVQSG